MGDDEIGAALRRGDDETAFALVDRRHGPAVFARCFDVLRDRALAEDALQETLFKAFRRRERVLEVAQLRPWLLRIGTRTALDLLRGSRRHQRRVERLRQRSDGEDVVAMIAPIDDHARDHEAVRAGLATLDPETRAGVLMRYQDEASWDDIAEAVGLAVDTIRMRVQRALPGLKSLLLRRGVEP